MVQKKVVVFRRINVYQQCIRNHQSERHEERRAGLHPVNPGPAIPARQANCIRNLQIAEGKSAHGKQSVNASRRFLPISR